VVVNFLFTAARDVIQLISMLIMVRILEPKDYGILSLVMGIFGTITIFAHQNFIAYTLQVKDESEVRYQNHFTMGGFIQVSMFILANIIALSMNYWSEYENISVYVHILSLTYLIEWPSELLNKIYERKMQWERRRILHMYGILFSSLLGVLMALLGFGPYSLIVPVLFEWLPIVYELFVKRGWRPTWEFDWAAYQPAIHFGMKRMASMSALKARLLFEPLIIVSTLGLGALGIYAKSVGLSQMFTYRIANIVMYTVYPRLTQYDEGGGQHIRANGIILKVIGMIIIPIGYCLAYFSLQIVQIMYGSQWTEVSKYLPLLSVISICTAYIYLMSMFIMSAKKEKITMYIDIIQMLATLIVLKITIDQGLLAFLEASVILSLIGFIIVSILTIKYKVITLKVLMKSLLPPILCGGVAILVVDKAFSSEVNLIYMAFQMIIFSIVFLILLRVVFLKYLLELIGCLELHKNSVVCKALFLKRV
jgi:teichuronic acid exporter